MSLLLSRNEAKQLEDVHRTQQLAGCAQNTTDDRMAFNLHGLNVKTISC